MRPGLGFILSLLISSSLFAADIHVKITDIRNDVGNIRLAIFDQAPAFPTKPELAVQKVVLPIQKSEDSYTSAHTFTDLAPGTYAISLIHDENLNGEFDMVFFQPTEGYGTSNDIRGLFGPPSFRDAKFALGDEDIELMIKVGY